jgi:hypothetical protein
MGNQVLHNIGNPAITPEMADQLGTDLDNLMVLSKQAPELFAKHFSPQDVARLEVMHNRMQLEGANPFEVVQRMQEHARLDKRGLLSEATPEQIADGGAQATQAFVREHGDWSINPFRYAAAFAWGGVQTVREGGQMLLEGVKAVTPGLDADSDKFGVNNIKMAFKDIAKLDPEYMQHVEALSKQYYEEEFAISGDEELAVAAAKARLNRGSRVIGGRAVIDGYKLDEASYGGNYDRFLEGIENDETSRQALITQWGLKEDFSLRSGMQTVVPSPDGRSATIWVEGADGTLKPVLIHAPTRPEQILPTRNEQWIESIRSNLLESRSSGAFQHQMPEEAFQQ